jgi:hypothetical protein
VKRRAAIAAELPAGVGCPQPVAASGALRIDALNGPSRQILHADSPLWNCASFFHTRPTVYGNRSRQTVLVPRTRTERKKLRGFCAASLVVSRKKIQSLVVVLLDAPKAVQFRVGAERAPGRADEKIPGGIFFLALQPFSPCTQSLFPTRETKG